MPTFRQNLQWPASGRTILKNTSPPESNLISNQNAGTMSTLLKWAQNTTQSKAKQQQQTNGEKSNGNGTSNGGKTWIHPPSALQKAHIAYLVKFMGNTSVDQPKGIDVVKDGIRKLQFNAQLRKAETGAKMHRKVELTISVDGVAIQEPRTHTILHQFPLHRISYCADDKGEKRFFAFIAKQPSADGTTGDKHECFVFVSDKLAEEIVLTIGQAFELAYKRFLDTSGKDLEAQRRAILSQQRIKRLETENNLYKQRLMEISQLPTVRPELDMYLRKNYITDILQLPESLLANTTLQSSSSSSPEYSLMSTPESTDSSGKMNGVNTTPVDNLLDMSLNSSDSGNGVSAPPVPPRRSIDLMGTFTPPNHTPSVGTRLEGLLLNEFDSDQDFDPRSYETNSHNTINNGPFADTNGNSSSPPLLAPPPKTTKRQNGFTNNIATSMDLFGSAPFTPPVNNSQKSMNNSGSFFAPHDPFEMGDFGSTATQQDLENAIGLLDKKILEMKDGFSQGLSFGNDDFSLESLDPLKN